MVDKALRNQKLSGNLLVLIVTENYYGSIA